MGAKPLMRLSSSGTSRLALFAGSVLTGALTLGCGGSEKAAESRLTANQSFEKANQLVESGDHAGAVEALNDALGSALDGDRREEAMVQRAILQARLGQADEALTAFAELEQYGTDLATIYAAKAYVLSKKGDDSGAKQAFSKAKRINRRIKPIRD